MSKCPAILDKFIEYLREKDRWLEGSDDKPWFLDRYGSLAECLEDLHPREHDNQAKALYDQSKTPGPPKAGKEASERLQTSVMAGFLMSLRGMKVGEGDDWRLFSDSWRDGRWDAKMVRAGASRYKKWFEKMAQVS